MGDQHSPVGSDRNTLKREERIVLDGSGDAVLAGSITWGGQPEQEERDAIEPLKEDARTDRLFSGESGSLSDTSGSYSDPDNMDEPLKATYQFRRASPAILDGEHLILLPRDVFSRELPLADRGTSNLSPVVAPSLQRGKSSGVRIASWFFGRNSPRSGGFIRSRNQVQKYLEQVGAAQRVALGAPA